MSVPPTITPRRARVERLLDLRKRIDAEIDQIEQEIEDEIAAMRRARLSAVKAKASIGRRRVAECGTDGGYYRHRRTLGEDACEACKLAHRVAESERRARREVA